MSWEKLVLIGVVAYFAYTFYLQQQQQASATAFGAYAATIASGLPIV